MPKKFSLSLVYAMAEVPSDALTAYRAEIAAIDARITELETTKTQTIDATLATVSADLISPRYAEEIGRSFESEINWLRFKRDRLSIEFAQSLL